MLVPAVKQQASNNLIMRLEMLGKGRGADAVLLPVSCQPVSCLSPCFSLAPCRAAAWADGAGSMSACHQRAGEHWLLHCSPVHPLGPHCRAEMLFSGLGRGMAGAHRVSQVADGWIHSPAVWPK